MQETHGLRIPFAWSDRHPVFLGRFLYIPGVYDHHIWKRIPWSDSHFFGNDHPVHIEFCSGNGFWLSEKAKKHPEINWVAVEKRFDRASKAWSLAQREKLDNVFVVCSEAVLFCRYYAPLDSVSEAYVNFPDPWPKRKDAKHRLIRKEFLEILQTILKKGSCVTLATDDRPYADRMIREFFNNSSWKSTFPDPYFICDFPDFGISFFSDLWQRKGFSIHYLQFKLDL